MLVPLEDATAAVAGGKAGTLGRLVRAGLPVPPGVVVPLDVYRATAERLAVEELVRRGGPGAAQRALARADLAPGFLAAVERALARLGGGPVAVRSSATGEDGATRSAAGQHLTRLGVRGAGDVVDAVRACWASLWSPEAVAYRRLDDGHDAPATAVLVQRHVDADVAGVLFTGDAPGDPVVVEASWGLGESVVGGLVTPDRHVVHASGAVGTRVGAKATRVDRDGAGVGTAAVPDALAAARCLDDAAVRGLADLGRELATLLGGPQDVEWALAGGVVHVLQARPVTAGLPRLRGLPDVPEVRAAGDGDRAAAVPTSDPSVAVTAGAATTDAATCAAGPVLRGVPGSRGVRRGPVRVVTGPEGFAAVRSGDVLVCRFTDPAWTRLFGVVAAVVTQTGGVLSHAAVVAREHGTPAVLAVPGVLVALRDGDDVEVDGTAGTVRLVT
ncbi:PEP/pyruvate-binding domain-containing protein [Cellulomonas sp. NS3]|uniref:PEP/pyruvate-binding domain-containing protein n=1 Tax=Cellulomonas sp. NS3 TaxID=2973977 RepID=UPI0021622B4E|nr:PEP/pyruvate-binding domain-containing protein [Cellulomonas sp. NS3]